MNIYYVYQYLREDLTPYYIGKGKNNRAYKKGKGEVGKPTDLARIQIIAHNLLEQEAHLLEIKLISQYGRKDLGTGILRNKTNGGEGSSGTVQSEETRKKKSITHKGKVRGSMPAAQKEKISKAAKLRDVSTRIQTEETKRKISLANKGRNNPFYGKTHTVEARAKMAWGKGIPKSAESRRLQSEAKKGIPKPKIVCRTLDKKEMSISGFINWVKSQPHNDN
jgi:hypothetical protein